MSSNRYARLKMAVLSSLESESAQSQNTEYDIGVDDVSVDTDVTFAQFCLNGCASKEIAYLGLAELAESQRKWLVALRLGGSHMVIGSCNKSVEDLYEQAVDSRQEHPSFYVNLFKDISETMRIDGIGALDRRGIMDFVWISPGESRAGKSPRFLVHPSTNQKLNQGARAYTKQVIKLVLPII